MKISRLIISLAVLLYGTLCVSASEIIVTVSPKQQIMPPQVMMYLDDPGRFFTVTLTNTTNDVQNVYLGLNMKQVTPANSDLYLSTPANRQPAQPFSVKANSSYQLTTVEMKKLFDHIPSSEIQCPQGLFENYTNGTFGLLPEGLYQAKIIAYKWNLPQYATPVVASNPLGGNCTFTVCYKAQAPQFLMPMAMGTGTDVAEVDPFAAQFTWTMPTITCSPGVANYTYDFKVVELYEGQQPDVAMDRNPVVYQLSGLLSNMCMLQFDVIQNRFLVNKTYIAQVTAKQRNATALDYVMLENNGKSNYRIFKFKNVTQKEDPKTDDEPEEEDGQKDDDKEKSTQEDGDKDKDDEEDDEEEDPFAIWGNTHFKDSLDTSALYNFRNPAITTPSFSDFGARKKFLRADIAVAWRKVWHIGGEGTRPDSLKFDYEVELFNGKGVIDKKHALETQPIYKNIIKGTEELTDTIPWDLIGEDISETDYLVLRVKPVCTNIADTLIAYHDDTLNVVDFAMAEYMSKKYFQCSDMVEIDNETPTTASADDLTGQTIPIGQYQLTIDEIKAGKTADTWEGKGRVEWNPLGTKVMVCVKFDDLKINTDLVVYGGTAKSYANDKNSNNDIVEKLFSDWGIDNYLSDSSIPYADQIQQTAKDKAKGLAEELDLSKYYEYVVVGQNVWNAIGKQNIDELYMPIALPKSITNDSPVDIQISTMKFAATHATMDLIGEFVLPNTDVLKDQILVFGAPRLCISPDNILPESGTIALLADLKLNDPESDFTFTFKAPQDLLEPKNGCYLSWHANEFELLGIDVAMAIPGLKKDSVGVALDECPELNIAASIESWDNWMVDNISMDPFQIDGCPGWTFTANNIVYDHSATRNSGVMGAFPQKYDKSQTLTDGTLVSWQGLYIDSISVKMPSALVFGDAPDRRCSIAAANMFFDSSGATLTVSGDSIFAAKTLEAGGWGFTLDHVSLEFIQTKVNGFNGCEFGGTLAVPLINSDIGYNCQIIKVNNDRNAKAGNYAYIFSTQQVKDTIDFDFFVAKAAIKKELTYLLVEATPGAEELETKVELLLGGSLSIGGKEYLQNKLKDIALEFSIPDVHFAKMRLANCEDWRSEYAASMQENARKGISDAILQLYKDKQFKWGNFYFNTGDWSLASEEKFLGPFSFSLSDYEFGYKNNELSVYLQGTLKFVESIELSASAGLEILSTVTGIEEMDFSKLSIKYKGINFKDASFNASFGGMKLGGSLAVCNNEEYGKGFSGQLMLSLPGDLFSLDAKGGYYEKPEFTWGYFDLTLSGQGLRFDPIVLSGVHGGFYFNCVKKSSSDDTDSFTVTPQNGVIGVILGMTLSTSAGEDALKGTFEMTVAYDSENDRLTTFLFTGDLKAVGGLVDAKATILYEHTDMEQYFALNITAEAGLSGEKALESVLGKDMQGFADKLSELNDQFEGAVTGVTAGLGDLSDQSEENADAEDRARAEEVAQKAQGEDVSVTVGHTEITVDLRITMMKEGKKLDNVKWHLYIGEPSEDKRCKFILVDFKSPIVSVNIGANAYLCLGNELPNDGELPPIPTKIQEFLDGSTKGAGVTSDDMNKATRARTRALENFKADVSGGIMLGASAWGFIDVDLGLFYGALEAMAGFDLSLRHLTNMTCMNLGKEPGYHGWYGEGQIYAYLAAVLGLKLDLGFWEGKLPILDAGIGGVLRMGGINPNYFTGAARVKLKAFGGLVDINRKFEFECGDVCDLFMGNALDNFELFGEFTLGDTIKSNGWNTKQAINPRLDYRPTIETLAPIDEHFRVLDQTELNIMARDWDGDMSQLETQASRTFIFHLEPLMTLYEYDSDDDKTPKKYNLGIYKPESFRTRHALNMIGKLSANKFYRLDISGNAKEIYEGVEDHPQTFNKEENEYEPVPWVQTRSYYFCTGDAPVLNQDSIDLQKYVALAYPSSYNELTTPEGMVDTAYVSDVASPIISLKEDLSNNCFTTGELYWILCDQDGTEIERVKNKWITQENVCVMTPETKFKNVEKNRTYTLKLSVVEITYDTVRVAKNPNSSSSGGLFVPPSTSLNPSQNIGNKPIIPAPMDEMAYMLADFPVEYEMNGVTLAGSSPQIRIRKVAADSVAIVLNNVETKVTKATFDDLKKAGAIVTSSNGTHTLTTAKFNAVTSKLTATTVTEIKAALEKQGTIKRTNTTTTSATTLPAKSSNSTETTGEEEEKSVPSLALPTKTNSSTSTEQAENRGGGKTLATGTLVSNVRNEMDKETETSDGIFSKKTGTTSDGATSTSSDAKIEKGTSGSGTKLEGVTVDSSSSSSKFERETSNSGTTLDAVVTEEEVRIVRNERRVLMNLKVRTVDGNWQEGYEMSGKRHNVAYEIPFIGQKAIGVRFPNNIKNAIPDNEIAKYNGSVGGTRNVLLRTADPYLYLSYLSNYAFIGGRRVTNDRMNIKVTTTESLIYSDISGRYAGQCGQSGSTRIVSEYNNVANKSIYVPGPEIYPIPFMEYDLYNYTPTGDLRTPLFTPSDVFGTNILNLSTQMFSVYELAYRLNDKIATVAKEVQNIGGSKFNSDKTAAVADWIAARTGSYLSVSCGFAKAEIPYYQFGLLWGSQMEKSGSAKSVTLWDSFDSFKDTDQRPHENLSEEIWYGFFGGTLDHNPTTGKKASYKINKDKLNFNTTLQGDFMIYRVNAYDLTTNTFKVLKSWPMPESQRTWKDMSSFYIYFNRNNYKDK